MSLISHALYDMIVAFPVMAPNTSLDSGCHESSLLDILVTNELLRLPLGVRWRLVFFSTFKMGMHDELGETLYH